MNFFNDPGKKTVIRVSNVKEDMTEAEVKNAMDVILAKNIFTTSDEDLKSKDSAEIDDKNTNKPTDTQDNLDYEQIDKIVNAISDFVVANDGGKFPNLSNIH